MQQGLLIYGVNGKPTPNSNALTTAVLNAMRVDPDGKARIVVEYAGSDLKRKVDLLTVGAVRLVNLSNGVSVRASVDDGVWTSLVTAVADPQMTTLKPGDVLFRDLTTEIPLDAPDALEKIMADLIAQGRTETGFSVIRNNKVDEATMQLSLANGPVTMAAKLARQAVEAPQAPARLPRPGPATSRASLDPLIQALVRAVDREASARPTAQHDSRAD